MACMLPLPHLEKEFMATASRIYGLCHKHRWRLWAPELTYIAFQTLWSTDLMCFPAPAVKGRMKAQFSIATKSFLKLHHTLLESNLSENQNCCCNVCFVLFCSISKCNWICPLELCAFLSQNASLFCFGFQSMTMKCNKKCLPIWIPFFISPWMFLGFLFLGLFSVLSNWQFQPIWMSFSSKLRVQGWGQPLRNKGTLLWVGLWGLRADGRVASRDWRDREVMIGRGTDQLLRNRLLLWARVGNRWLQRKIWETSRRLCGG